MPHPAPARPAPGWIAALPRHRLMGEFSIRAVSAARLTRSADHIENSPIRRWRGRAAIQPRAGRVGAGWGKSELL